MSHSSTQKMSEPSASTGSRTIDPDFKNAEPLTAKQQAKQPSRRRPRLQCPKCATRLRVRRFQGVVLEECPDCAGMWFDRGEFEIASRDKGEQWTARFLKNLTNLITNPTPVHPKQ